MPTGTVSWYDFQKGWGFIQQDEGGPDAFVHYTAVDRAGFDALHDGMRLSYELVQNKKNGKLCAENLQEIG